MSVAYFVHRDPNVLVSVYWGRTTPEETKRMRAARERDADRASVVAHVIDLSRFEGSTASPVEETRTLAALGAKYVDLYGLLPTVVIATEPHVFGEARAFQIQATNTHPDAPVAVASSWAEAARFLALDLAAVRRAVDDLTRR